MLSNACDVHVGSICQIIAKLAIERSVWTYGVTVAFLYYALSRACDEWSMIPTLKNQQIVVKSAPNLLYSILSNKRLLSDMVSTDGWTSSSVTSLLEEFARVIATLSAKGLGD